MIDWLSRLILRPVSTLVVGLFLAAFSLWLAYHRLSFTTDRTQLLDPRDQVQQDWARYRQEFGRTTDYVVLVQASDPQIGHKATDQLGQSLLKSPHFQSVFYRLDLPQLSAHGLYFLKTSELERLLRWLRAAKPWLDLVARRPGLGGIMRELSAETNPTRLALRIKPILPVLVKSLECLADSLESGGRAPFQTPLGPYYSDVPMLQGGSVKPGQSRFYNQLDKGRTTMLVALPRDTSGSFRADIATLQAMQSLVAQVRRSYPEVTFLITGEPAINTEEMVETRRDAATCAAAALLFTSLFLVLAFGQLTRPLCAVFSLVLGLAWSIGFASLAVGQLNLLTVHFVTILTGLGITFGIQMLSEFQKLRALGQLPAAAVACSLQEARHQAVGALTTAIAFFSLQFTSFRAAAELGWISGMGVLLCYLSTLTMLPSLLVLAEGQRPCTGHPGYGRWMSPVEVWFRRRPRMVLLICLIWSGLCCSYAGRIPFDYNLLHLQGEKAEAIRVETYLQSIGYSTLYAISLAPDVATARRLSAEISQLPSVSRVESVLSLEPKDLATKAELIHQLVLLAPSLQLPPQAQQLGAAQLIEIYRAYLGLRGRLMNTVAQLRNTPDGPRLLRVIRRLEKLLNPNNPGPMAAGLMSFQLDLLQEMQTQLHFLKEQKDSPPDILGLVPPEVLSRSVSPQGTVCLRIFPKEDCWERLPLGRFVAELSRIDPHITGTPVLIYHYIEQLRAAYSVAGRNALIVISLLLLAYYRSWRLAGLALLPKLMGVVWMIGGMGMLESQFNAANFLALPLTLGIGLIFGMESLRMSRIPGSPLMSRQSAGFAVALSGLTTLLGFSMLMNAEHRGVASFGLVMSLGVGMNLLTSLIFLPALMSWNRLREN
jgi:hopanoid biosynthesis associated RND transporter like protein HpnN